MFVTSNLPTRFLAALVVAVSLGACATPDGGPDHGAHHPDQRAGSAASGPASPSGGGAMMGHRSGSGMMGGAMMGGTQSGGGTMAGRMDKDAMCAMYRGMQNAATQQERQAMMDQHMKGMSPEMRQQHMEMMRQQCK